MIITIFLSQSVEYAKAHVKHKKKLCNNRNLISTFLE